MFRFNENNQFFEVLWFNKRFASEVFTKGFFLSKEQQIDFNKYFSIESISSNTVKLTFLTYDKISHVQAVIHLNNCLKKYSSIGIIGMEIEVPTHTKMIHVYGEKFSCITFFSKSLNYWSYLDTSVKGVLPFRWAQQLCIAQDAATLVNCNHAAKVQVEVGMDNIKSLVIG